MISLVMPAKNASDYINEAIDAILNSEYSNWELIVIEDHSEDNTFEILQEYSEKDSRIKIFKNKGIGKVDGLNYGFSKTSGEYIKCIDADDILKSDFFNSFKKIKDFDALCHDAFITNENGKIIGKYNIDKDILNQNYVYCLKFLKSPPRWTWTFKRHVAEKIFPMPDELPFEDVWFSLVIKKYSKQIKHINKPLYYYRQHSNQVYGGILNSGKEVVQFRARRILKLLEVIKNEPNKQLVSEIDDIDSLFSDIKTFNELLSKDKLKVIEIVRSKIPLFLKAKCLIYRKFNFLAPLIIKFKWLIDKKS